MVALDKKLRHNGPVDVTRGEHCGFLIGDDPRRDDMFEAIAGLLVDVDLERVVVGDAPAIAVYVDAWRTARSCVLTHVRVECPQLKLPLLTSQALDWEAIQAPFSIWVQMNGDSDGLALDLIARFRQLVVGAADPLLPTDIHTEHQVESLLYTTVHVEKFYRQVVATLQGHGSLAAQITEALGLNKAELGRLFGVSRQAAADWLEGAVPSDRRAKAAVIVAIADLLGKRLKPGRLPGVARRRAPAYGGLSMLDMIAQDRQEELLESIRESFDFSQTA